MRRLVVVVLLALSASGLACNQGGRPFRRPVRPRPPRPGMVPMPKPAVPSRTTASRSITRCMALEIPC